MSFENRPPHEGHLESFGLATRRVIRFGVGYLAAALLSLVFVLSGVAALESGAADPMSVGTQATVQLGGLLLGTVMLVCLAGLLISTVGWIISAHRATPTGPGAVGYGGLLLALVLMALNVVLVTGALVTGGLRLAAWAALIGAVVATRSRVRRETGRPDLGGRRLPIVTGEDWDASRWDPEVLRDIERRGRPTE